MIGPCFSACSCLCRLNDRYSYVWKDRKSSSKTWAGVPAECLFVCSKNIHVTDSYSGIWGVTLTSVQGTWGLHLSRTVEAAIQWGEQDVDRLSGSFLDYCSHPPDSVGTGFSLSSSGHGAGSETAKEESQSAESQTNLLGILYRYKLISDYLSVNNEGNTSMPLPSHTKLSSSFCILKHRMPNSA